MLLDMHIYLALLFTCGGVITLQGVCPLAVIGTAATTVVGAFDPLDEIASICEKHSVWLHADAALGGSVLVSHSLRSKVAGIQRYLDLGFF